MKPGPRVIPTAIKVLNGNPGGRPLNKNEPTPEPSTVEGTKPPEYLDAAGVKEWDRILPILLRMRVMTEGDYQLLITWCIHTSILAKSYGELKKQGLIIESKKTHSLQQNPLLIVVNKSTELVLKIAKEFGLTPSSRTGLEVSTAGPVRPDNNWSDVDEDVPN